MSVWTDEKVEALKKLWNQPGRALSYGEIGDILGFNRNAIAGKCDRLGLKRGRVVLANVRRQASAGVAAAATTRTRVKKPDAGHPWVQGNERSHRLATAKAVAELQGPTEAPVAVDAVQAGFAGDDASKPVAPAKPAAVKTVSAETSAPSKPKEESTELILFGGVAPVAAVHDLPIPFGAKEAELDGKPMRGLGLMDLNDRTCHWPVGDPLRPDFFFCGRSIATGDVYCRFHLSVRVSKYQGRSRSTGTSVRALPQRAYA